MYFIDFCSFLTASQYSTLLQEMYALYHAAIILGELYPYNEGIATAAETLVSGIDELGKLSVFNCKNHFTTIGFAHR